MPAKRGLFIPDVLEEHGTELPALWRQRAAAIRAPNYTLRALANLDERVAARVDGLVVGGRHALPLLRKGLEAEKPEDLFAAAYPLLALGKEKIAARVLEKFLEAKGPRLDGLARVLCHTPLTGLFARCRQALASPEHTAVAVAEVLASHSLLDFTSAQFERFLKHADPIVRRTGWRAVGMALPVRPEVYEAGFRDPDLGVRDEALLAAAWGRQPKVLDYCRKLAAAPAPEHAQALLLLAVLGRPEDLPRLQLVARTTTLGPQRFRLLGAFGHPNVVESLLTAMEGKDPLAAEAASAAWLKITGADVGSGRRVPVPPPGGTPPTEFESEFLDEVELPDPVKARAHWQKEKARFQKGTRWCRGTDLSQGGSRDDWNRLDMETRHEAYLRGKYLGLWKDNPFVLERFPQTYVPDPPKK